MHIEIGAPACLPLGFIRHAADGQEQIHLLGLTIQHPPIQLAGYRQKSLNVTGPRADLAHDHTLRFLETHHLPRHARIEIELAIPSFVGLGSDAMLGLSMGRALAWIHDLPYPEEETLPIARALRLDAFQSLEIWAFDRGGLLLVETDALSQQVPSLIQRWEIAHQPKEAWAFVLYLPRVPDGTPANFESARIRKAHQAAAHLSEKISRAVLQNIETALKQDDIGAFGQSLMDLQTTNREVLERAGVPGTDDDGRQEIFAIMRDFGVAWGTSVSGFCQFALVHGSTASVELRKALRDKVGFFGGRVMATITDNAGAQHLLKDEHGRLV